MAAIGIPILMSIIGAGTAIAGTIGAAKAGRRQEEAQQRSQDFQERQLAKQEKRQGEKELAFNTSVSRKRRAQTAGRLGIGLGGRRSLFFEGNELGVTEEGQRATLG